MSRLPKPAHHRAHALQWEAHAPKLESRPPSLQLAKAHGSNKNPAHSHKEINNLKKKLFALKKNNVYFYGTMTARIALIVHNCFLWTAPFCFTRLSQNLSVSLHLHGSHSFLAPGLAPPMLSDLKQDCHLLLSFSAQRRSYPALWHHKNLP